MFHNYLIYILHKLITYSNRNVSTAQYFAANILILAMSTALTVLVLNVHHRGSLGKPVPAMVQLVVLDWLAKILGMGKCVSGKNKITSNSAKTVWVSSNLISKHLVDEPILRLSLVILFEWLNINGLVQDCGISMANALELLQSYPKPSISDYTGCCYALLFVQSHNYESSQGPNSRFFSSQFIFNGKLYMILSML